jgi:tryptophan-rich sensory protein
MHFQLLQIYLYVLISRVSWIMLFLNSQLSFVRYLHSCMDLCCLHLIFIFYEKHSKEQDNAFVFSLLWNRPTELLGRRRWEL